MVMGQISDRELHEECGVFGVFGVKDAASLTYYGLHALQHRGQEGAGIVTVDRDATFRRIKGGGLVTEVFGEGNLSTLKGDMAIGHVRYTTAGGGGIENGETFPFRHNTGDFALAHNGNIVNSALLRIYLENKGSLFQSTSDSEILAHLIKKETKYHDRPRIYSIIDALNMIEGAFAFLIMTANRIYACRDKYGLRPPAVRRASAVDRPAGRRLCRVERNLCLRRAGCGVRPRRRAGRDRHDRQRGHPEPRFLAV